MKNSKNIKNKKLIAGNWKMNLDRDGINSLTAALIESIDNATTDKTDVLLCPPYIYLDRLDKFLTTKDIAIGAQNCAAFENGAYTGEVSAEMLKDMGCKYVILGHSERRQIMGETNEMVKQKAAQALKAGITPIICVGETEEERNAAREQEVVGFQVNACVPDGAMGENIVIAYEPVWAIGTGKTATTDDVAAMHAFIRDTLKEKLDNPDKVRILYGGSMKPNNAAELLATENVDGGLIGGASLKVEDFKAIIDAV